MRFRFPVVIIDEDFRSENASGLGIRTLADAIEKEGIEVLGVTNYGDLTSFAQQQARASAFVLSIDDEELAGSDEDTSKALQKLRSFVEEVRFRNAEIPIFLHGETRTARHIPNDILRELNGFIHMLEDTPEFLARYIGREARAYLESLVPPFFRALHRRSRCSFPVSRLANLFLTKRPKDMQLICRLQPRAHIPALSRLRMARISLMP